MRALSALIVATSTAQRSGTSGFCNDATAYTETIGSACANHGQTRDACETHAYHTCPTQDTRCTYRRCAWNATDDTCRASGYDDTVSCVCRNLELTSQVCIVDDCSVAKDPNIPWRITAIKRHANGDMDAHCDDVTYGFRTGACDEQTRSIYRRLEWRLYDDETNAYVLGTGWVSSEYQAQLESQITFVDEEYVHVIEDISVHDQWAQYHLCVGSGTESSDTMYRVRLFDSKQLLSDDIMSSVPYVAPCTDRLSNLASASDGQITSYCTSPPPSPTPYPPAPPGPPPPMRTCTDIANSFIHEGCCESTRRRALYDPATPRAKSTYVHTVVDGLDFPRSLALTKSNLLVATAGRRRRDAALLVPYFADTTPSTASVRVTKVRNASMDQSATVLRCGVGENASCIEVLKGPSLLFNAQLRPNGFSAMTTHEGSVYAANGPWDTLVDTIERPLGWIYALGNFTARESVVSTLSGHESRTKVTSFFSHNHRLFAVDTHANAIVEVLSSRVMARVTFPPRFVVVPQWTQLAYFHDAHPTSAVVCAGRTYAVGMGAPFENEGLLYTTTDPSAWNAAVHTPALLRASSEFARPMRLQCFKDTLFLLHQTSDPRRSRVVRIDQDGTISGIVLEGLAFAVDMAMVHDATFVSAALIYVALGSPPTADGAGKGRVEAWRSFGL